MASSLPPLVPVPFAEAIAWAKARGVVLPSVYYGQLQGLARAKAFSVAGVTKLDQLLLVHESLNAAIGTGQTFAEWKKGVLAQDSGLGAMPEHRLDNIFRTNLQSDYARGRCEQQGRNRERFPWLLYDAVNDSRTRPAHAAMDGFIARYDDPIWAKWRPPCGYRCRCRLISLTEKQAQRYIDADARRLGNNKPQDHLWGLTYAQARSRAISEGPDDGWDYDICQECGGSLQDHCSGASRGVEQATEDRLRTLHEVAGTPGGQALEDAVAPALISAMDAAIDAVEKVSVITMDRVIERVGKDFADKVLSDKKRVAFARQWGLTDEELILASDYTAMGYTDINAVMRGAMDKPEILDIISATKDAIAKCDPVSGTPLVRILNFEHLPNGKAIMDDFISAHSVGNTIEYPAFSSCTNLLEDVEAATNYADVRVHISGANGNRVTGLGQFDESEVILPPGWRGRVVRTEKDSDGVFNVFMEQEN